MLTEIFKSVLLMSAVGGILGVFWLCIKPVTRRLFSPKWQYYVWLTVLLVLILPVRFRLPQQAPDMQLPAQTAGIHTEIAENPASAAELQTPTAVLPQIPEITLPQNLLWYLSVVWFLGMIAVFLVKTGKYLLFLRAIHKNSYAEHSVLQVPKRLQVRRTDMLDAPLIIGLIKPVLYLPDAELSETSLNYIFMHELTHYRRRDLLYKWAAALVLSVHWFNPVVYIVSKQIDLDCEVSCDFLVTDKLSEQEQKNYMNMILNMLLHSKSSLRPLTTQMASNKKILKRRFEMIRSRKRTNKFVSAFSLVLMLIVLGTTVFASGVLSGTMLKKENGNMIVNGQEYAMEVVHLDNIRYLNTDSYYVPLRQAFELLGCSVYYGIPGSDAPDWMRERQRQFPQYDWRESFVSDEITSQLYGATTTANGNMPIIEIVSPGREEFYCQVGSERYSTGWAPPVILMDNTAYIPIRALAYYVGGEENVKWNDAAQDTYYEGALRFDAERLTIDIHTENTPKFSIGTKMWGENGELVFDSDVLKEPENAVHAFFKVFSKGDFTLMKNYCTEACISRFFGDGYCFGMKKAELAGIDIDWREYLKSSNDFNVFVTVNMVPHEISVFDASQTSTSFYVLFLRQPDGRYLIDGFATGL